MPKSTAATADPPGSETQASAGASRLRGNLGTASIVFMVAAAASPLGVVGGPVPLGISIGDGTGFPATYIISGIALLLFAVGFTTMTPFVKSAGAFYSYIERGLGRGTGLGSGFAALLSYVTLEAGVYGLIGPGINSLLVSYGVSSLPWWVYAAVVLVIVAVLSHRNIELSGKVLAVGLVAEVLVVLAFDVAVTVSGGKSGLSAGIVDPHQVFSGAPGVGILFAILSFIGFEATAVFRDEARDPERTVPRATYIALLLIGVFYTISSWALVSAYGDQNAVKAATADSGNMLTDATLRYLGAPGEHVIQVLYVTSLFACILSLHNVGSRYTFVLSGRNAISPAFSQPHEKFGSPHRASAATSAVVAVLLIIGAAIGLDPINQYYTWLAGFASVGVVVLYALTSGAVATFFARNPGHRVGWWKTTIAPVISLLALIGFLVLILENLTTLVGGSTPLAIGVVVILVLAFLLGPVVARLRRDKLRPELP